VIAAQNPLLFALTLAAWFALTGAASSGPEAQPDHRPPQTVRVVLDNNYPPYSFHSDDGKLQGVLVDQWRAWESKTGIKVEITGRTGRKRCAACVPASST